MRRWSIGVVLSLSLLTAACTSGDGEPDNTPPQYAPPAEDWAPAMAQCLTGKGWSPQAHPDGSLQAGGVPLDQKDQFDADFDACAEELGYHLPREPITAERAAQLWDEYLAAADCVAELGYHVDDPPSRGFAIEQLQQSPIRLGWHPHENVPPLEQDDAYRECPAPVL